MKKNGISFERDDSHHWCYLFLEEVFVMSRSDHRQVHKLLKFDDKKLMFSDLDDNLLDTKEKHEKIVKKVTDDYLFVKLNE